MVKKTLRKRPGFDGAGPMGIAPELFNTFYMLILTEIFLSPISLGAALYLVEYARQGWLTTVNHFAAEALAGRYIRLVVLADRLIVDTASPLHKEYPLV